LLVSLIIRENNVFITNMFLDKLCLRIKSKSTCRGVNQELIAVVIYHEAFHALINTFDPKNAEYSATDEHIAMFSNYLDLLSNALIAAYPDLSPRDAKD
jgi:hypothetical protein